MRLVVSQEYVGSSPTYHTKQYVVNIFGKTRLAHVLSWFESNRIGFILPRNSVNPEYRNEGNALSIAEGQAEVVKW